MVRNCDACQKPYQAKRANSKYCSARCRQRAKRAPEKPIVPVADLPALISGPSTLGLEDATRRALESVEQLDSPEGQAALLLARRLDGSAMDTGSSIAAMVREHRATLTAAIEGGKVAADPLDQLAQRRLERIGHN